MKEQRLPSYPLINIDPYFSLWSASDKLNASPVVMWTGAEKPINGNITVDGMQKRFMGTEGADDLIDQVRVSVGMTSTEYVFEDKNVRLTVTFTSPLLLNDLARCSRPVTYIDLAAESIDGKAHDIEIMLDFSEKLCYEGVKKLTRAATIPFPEGNIGYLGRVFQKTIATSGDRKEIDWGWLYLAGQSRILVSSELKRKQYYKKSEIDTDKNYRAVLVSHKKGLVAQNVPLKYFVALAYDDVYSVNYFGEYKKGYWTTANYSIVNAVQDACVEHDKLIADCRAFDAETEAECAPFGETYYRLLAAAYRQILAGHKMCFDGENVLYFSKECSSNGCMATVDISYPSAPLFLLKSPELLKGMLVPVFKFARMRVWKFRFAPHDIGRYPYATGQAYGANSLFVIKNSYFPHWKHIYQKPDRRDTYNMKYQMPVEESGNMLILCAAYYNETGDAKFVRENADLLSEWADYLVAQGILLENQLCTDDFAGHSERNVNLAMKGILGIYAWGLLLNVIREGEGERYLEKARAMARELETVAFAGDRTTLTVDDRKSWSLKYNLVWDKLFGGKLFSEELYRKEIEFYLSRANRYGIPLDSRATYTKSDWMMWVAALDESGKLTAVLAQAILKMLEETRDRKPFSDWFDALTAECKGFEHRTVQGGLWMPLYAAHVAEGKGYLFGKK